MPRLENLDRLAHDFTRLRIRQFSGMTFEQWCGLSAHARRQYVRMQKKRLRDWSRHPYIALYHPIVTN